MKSRQTNLYGWNIKIYAVHHNNFSYFQQRSLFQIENVRPKIGDKNNHLRHIFLDSKHFNFLKKRVNFVGSFFFY